MFHPKKKLVVFFSPKKPQMSAATSRQGSSPAIWREKINRQKFSRHYIINHLISITVDIKRPDDGNFDRVWQMYAEMRAKISFGLVTPHRC
jgi:hypothetical protein